MSHSSKIFEAAPVKVQNRNGFDLSHLNYGTAKCGQLVPVMCKLLPPNSKFTLGVQMEVNLPPLATNFYGRIDAIVEAFVVPLSILYGGWKQFIMNQQSTDFSAGQTAVEAAGGYKIPKFFVHRMAGSTTTSPGVANWNYLFDGNNNIYEYLGVRQNVFDTGAISDKLALSMLPGLAYHLIWDKWYRNKQITRTIFEVNPNWALDSGASGSAGYSAKKNVSLIWHSWYSDTEFSYNGAVGSAVSVRSASPVFSDTASLTWPDGVSFFSTRQRNYARDYFTSAMPDPQQGAASRLQFSVDLSTGDGSFSIGALRMANSLEKFLETNGLSGDYADQMKNRWGVKPIDADFEEPYYLGRVVLPVYKKTIYGSMDSDDPASITSQNPFKGQLGSRGGSASANGGSSICDSFVSTTWAYVFAMFSLVPHANYGYGLNRELQMVNLGDFPAPEMQSVGHEEILCSELFFDQSSYDTGVNYTFGYIPRYSRFKYMDDEIHGELRPGKTFDSYVLQRLITPPPTTPAVVKLSTSFVEIPQNALDKVFAVNTYAGKLSCWYEIFFEFKVAMPLADFCIPTLGDIQDTHTIKTPIGGSRL